MQSSMVMIDYKVLEYKTLDQKTSGQTPPNTKLHTKM